MGSIQLRKMSIQLIFLGILFQMRGGTLAISASSMMGSKRGLYLGILDIFGR